MLTPKQEQKYWRDWGKIARERGWAHEPSARQSERRRALHVQFGLPESHKQWTNAHFSRWLNRTSHLRGDIDTRDRERETAIWTIERLREALHKLVGHDYARALLIDWADTNDLDRLPLTDVSMVDLENLRNTLKNRLGRIIERIRNGELEPGPECPAFKDQPQAYIIAHLIDRLPIKSKAAEKAEGMAAMMAEIKAQQDRPAPRGRTYRLDGGSRTFSSHVPSAVSGGGEPTDVAEPKAPSGLAPGRRLMSGNGKATRSGAPGRNASVAQPALVPISKHTASPATRPPLCSHQVAANPAPTVRDPEPF